MMNKLFFTLLITSVCFINAMEMETKKTTGFYLFNNTDCDFYPLKGSEEKNINGHFIKTSSAKPIQPGTVRFVLPHDFQYNCAFFSKLCDKGKNYQQCYNFSYPPKASYTLSLINTTAEILKQWPRYDDIDSITSWEKTEDNTIFRLVKHPSTMDKVVKIESSEAIPSLNQLCSLCIQNCIDDSTIDSSAVATMQNLWLPKDISLQKEEQ